MITKTNIYVGSVIQFFIVTVLIYRYLRVAVLSKVANYEDVLPDSEKRQYTDKALDLFNDWLNRGKP